MDDSPVDRRVRRTRQALYQALNALILEKRYDRITVQDILDRAQVARSTFYAHFLDKDDLLWHGFARISEQIRTDLKAGGHTNPGNGLIFDSLVFFRHAHLQRGLHRAMMEGGGAEVLLKLVRGHLEAEFRSHMQRIYPNENECPISVPMVTCYLAGALLSVSRWWLEEDRAYSPDEIDHMFQQLALTGLERLLSEEAQPTGGKKGRTKPVRDRQPPDRR